MHTEMGTVITCCGFPRGDANHLTCSQLRSDHICIPPFDSNEPDIGWDIPQRSSPIPLPLSFSRPSPST